MKKNLQISIEMLSVYSLVLLMFTILLASISTQASVAISQQLYLQLLANAQDFASRIQRAYSYGNGYKESFYFPAEVGFVPFNLTITGPGIITASAKYGNKVLSAYAFSGVQSYYLDSYYAIQNGYSIPIATGVINIVNSNGLICINSQTCPAYKIPKYISIYATNSTASATNSVTIIAKVTDQFGNPIPYPWVGFSTTLGLFSNNKQTQFVQGDGMGIAKVTLKSNSQKGIAKVTATAFNGNSSIVSNLAAWFPLNENQQNITFDVKNNNNGNAYNIGWLSAIPISSASFNGVNAYINIADSQSLDITNAITIMVWVYPKTRQTVSDRDGIVIKGAAYYLTITPTGYTAVYFYGLANPGYHIGTIIVPLNQWSLIATTYNSTTGKIRIYVNNILDKEISTSGTISTTTYQLAIGSEYTGSSRFFNGSIANVQIYNTALTPQQIQQLYLQGINSPPIPNAGLVGWWPLQGNANDYSSYNNNGIIYNAIFVPINVTQVSNLNVSSSPIINQFPVVGKFSGGNAYINIPDTGSSSLDVRQVSIVAWINPKTYNFHSDRGIIVNKESAWEVGLQNITGKLQGAAAPGCWRWAGTKVIPLNTWTQIAVIWTGKNEYHYVNGILVDNFTDCSTPLTINDQDLRIGARGGDGTPSSYFNGSIANVQIYSTALTPQQIQQLYLQGINSPPIPNAGLVGWWPLQGNANDYSSYGNNGTAYNVNFVRSNYSYLPVYQSSNKSGATFNGVNSYIQISPSQSLNLPGNSESIFLWVKFTNGNYILFQANAWNRRLFSTSWAFYDANNVFYSVPNGNPNDGNWHLVGYTISGNTVNTYKDGNLVASATRSVNAAGPASSYWWLGRVCSGSSCNLYFNGSIANVQIYNSSLTPQQIQQLYYAGIPPSNEIRIVLK